MDIIMGAKRKVVKRGATTTDKNKTKRCKNFICSVESGELERFDVRVMEKYPAYYDFFPRMLINDFIRKYDIKDAAYRHFNYLCRLVVDRKVSAEPDFTPEIGKKRIKAGRFARVRFYTERFLMAVYEAIKIANARKPRRTIRGRVKSKMEAC
ncbi:hypothetical protein ACNE9Y_31775 [Pseudomonas sp. NY11226]|uniref:hypothetical protein n=1 Tax=Pseudomonas sp. NY11226 TaxID=3400362 RepID=UPI003A844F94